MNTIVSVGWAGCVYGDRPGSRYLDIHATIRRARSGRWSVELLETRGSAHGIDVEDYRKKVIGRGDTMEAAARDARKRAQRAGVDTRYIEEAITEAEEAVADL